MFFQYPYTDLYSLNLDWLIKSMREVQEKIEQDRGERVLSFNTRTGTVTLMAADVNALGINSVSVVPSISGMSADAISEAYESGVRILLEGSAGNYTKAGFMVAADEGIDICMLSVDMTQIQDQIDAIQDKVNPETAAAGNVFTIDAQGNSVWAPPDATETDALKAKLNKVVPTVGATHALIPALSYFYYDGQLRTANVDIAADAAITDSNSSIVSNDGLTDVLNNAMAAFNQLDEQINPEGGGTPGQFLQVDSNGNTIWGPPATEAAIGAAVTSWLDTNVPTGTTVVVDRSLTVDGAAADAKITGDELGKLKSQVSDVINTLDIRNNDLTSGKYWTMTEGQEPTTDDGSASLYTPTPIDLSNFSNGMLRIEVSGGTPSGIRCFGFVDENNIVIKRWVFVNAPWQQDGNIYYMETPILTNKFLFSCLNSLTIKLTATELSPFLIDAIHDVASNIMVTAYKVSTTGNDNGDGINTPFATVNKALEMGASVVLIEGGVYNQQINLSKLKNRQLMIAKATHNARVVFRSPSLEITSARNVTGYNNVLSAAFTGTIDENCTYLWQENVPDTRTEISDLDRHPLQRGQQYRLLDTKIQKCNASVLEDALTEIENSQDFKWYFDSANSAIYFSCPSTVSSVNPVCGDATKKTLFSSPALKNLKLIGIDSKYMAIDLTFSINPELIDCKVSNCTCDGGFKYDRVVGAKFVRCEACGVAYGTTGDGFNAHSWTSGDAYAKQTTCELIDCWAHDNNDDGYSDHERSEAIIRGGLYEYNHKGGVTPAHGSHCVCYNVISRYNSNGFFYIGAASTAEGGMYGQMMCFDCVSKGNGADENARGAGFRVSNGHNSLYLVNCHSIGDYDAYEAQDTTIAQLVSCTAQETTHEVKTGIGTFNIMNGSLVN